MGINSFSSVQDSNSAENRGPPHDKTDILSSSISKVSEILSDSYSKAIDPSENLIFDDSLSQNENSSRRDSGVACDNMELDDMVIKEKDIIDSPISISNAILEKSSYNANPIINNSGTVSDIIESNVVNENMNTESELSKFTKLIPDSSLNNNLLNPNNEFQGNSLVSTNSTSEISAIPILSQTISTSTNSNSDNENCFMLVDNEVQDENTSQSKL